jgi:ribosomal protein S27AE
MHEKCLGHSTLGRPAIVTKQCPECGEEVELFADEPKARCSKCGCTVYNE